MARRWHGAAQSLQELPMRDPRNVLIVLLIVAVAVLGYLYYDAQRTTVKIDVPGFKLEAK
jgi:hypothetical protein